MPEGLSPADPEIKVLTSDASNSISFQTFHTERTQDWTHYDLVFNSLDHHDAALYLGSVLFGNVRGLVRQMFPAPHLEA